LVQGLKCQKNDPNPKRGINNKKTMKNMPSCLSQARYIFSYNPSHIWERKEMEKMEREKED